MQLCNQSLEKLRDLINEGTCYRSGPNLIKFFAALGCFNDPPYGRDFGSRKDFTDRHLAAINGTPELDKCINNLFNPAEFAEDMSKLEESIRTFNKYLMLEGWKVVRNNADISIQKATVDVDAAILNSKKKPAEETSVKDFLAQEFESIKVSAVVRDTAVAEIIQARIDEMQRCLKVDASLSAVILAGSSLEGVLLSIACADGHAFASAKGAPQKDGKSNPFEEWHLANLIDVAFELGYFKEDVRKFSQTLREFRNYIHPYAQMCSRFAPDKETAKICLQVLRAALVQIGRKLKADGK